MRVLVPWAIGWCIGAIIFAAGAPRSLRSLLVGKGQTPTGSALGTVLKITSIARLGHPNTDVKTLDDRPQHRTSGGRR